MHIRFGYYDTADMVKLLPDLQSPFRLLKSSKEINKNRKQDVKMVKYEALSYVWGDEKDVLPITVNGKHFLVTRNLRDFLSQLRNKNDRRGPYWTDAICINQNDNEEKNVQVAMMGDIYSNCARCLAWLGEADSKTEKAFELLRAIEIKAREALKVSSMDTHYRLPPYTSSKENSFRWRLYFDDVDFEKALKDLDVWNLPVESFSAEVYATVYELIARKWFQRMWILQEFVLPRNFTFLCGDHTLEDVTLMVFSRLDGLALDTNTRKIGNKTVQRDAGAQLNSYGACYLRADFEGSKGWHSLPYCASVVGRKRQAGWPSDKIYALMAISQQEKPFPINYSLSPAEVYREFAVHNISHSSPDVVLELFSAVGLRGEVEGLPSWVPDYTASVTAATAFTVAAHENSWLEKIVLRESELLYMGAGGCGGRLDFSADFKVIKASGIHFDTIKSLHTSPYVRVTSKQVKEYIAEEGLDTHSYTAYSQPLEDIIHQIASSDSADVSSPPHRIRISKSKNIAKLEAKGLITYPTYVAENRALIATETGYLGLGPLDSEVGDIVVVLEGQPFPFVLRRREDGFIMVGLAYGM